MVRCVLGGAGRDGAGARCSVNLALCESGIKRLRGHFCV